MGGGWCSKRQFQGAVIGYPSQKGNLPHGHLGVVDFSTAATHVLLMLKILHDLGILWYRYSQGIRYLGSCRNFEYPPSLNGNMIQMQEY